MDYGFMIDNGMGWGFNGLCSSLLCMLALGFALTDLLPASVAAMVSNWILVHST